MADKNSVSDWDTTPDNNDNIAGLPLGENLMYPRHVNNAFRNMMAQLKTYLGAITVDLGATIHALTGKTTPVDADEFGISDSAATFAGKKVTWANVKATIFAAWGALIAAGTNKTVPVDADKFLLADSAATNATKYVTFTQAWQAYFKAKADALYQPLVTILTTFAALANASGVLTNNGSGTLSWAASTSGGMTLLATLTTTSGTTQTATGLATTYFAFFIAVEGVNIGAQKLGLNISSDNGSTFDTAVPDITNYTNFTNAPQAATIWLAGVGDTAPKSILCGWGTGGTDKGSTGGGFFTKTSPTNALRFTGGTFTAGTIKIYGVK